MVTWRGKELMAQLRPRVSAGVRKVALQTEGRIKVNMPVDTGTARASVHTEVEESVNEIKATVGPGVEYAVYIELGTRGRPGKAPVAQAFSGVENELRAELRDLL